MNFASLYKSFIRTSKRVTPTAMETNKIYLLKSYEYSNGKTETFSGKDLVLIFVFGIFEKEVHALKLNTINPDVFFRWMKRASSRRVTDKMLNESDLKSLLKKSEESGQSFFKSRIKGNAVYKIEPRAYRTYKLFNIKNIDEVYLKREKLESIFGSPTVTDEKEKELDKPRIEPKELSKEIVERTKPNESKEETSIDDFFDAAMDILNNE
jgi:hypothetical protein